MDVVGEQVVADVASDHVAGVAHQRSGAERVLAAGRGEDEKKETGLTVSLADYNKMRAERDILSERVKVAEKRASAAEFKRSQADQEERNAQVRRMAAEENKALRSDAERLRSELAAVRTAFQQLQSKSAQVLSEKAKEDLKDKCAKLLDDQAAILVRTGRSMLVDQAEDYRRLAVTMRALKL